MAKRKKKDRSAQSAHRLRLNGLQAFRDGNYNEALAEETEALWDILFDLEDI